MCVCVCVCFCFFAFFCRLKILGGPFDTDWWRLSSAAKEGHGGAAPREQEFQDIYVGTSTSGVASSSRRSSQFPSPRVEGAGDSSPADDRVAGVWGRGISIGERRGGGTRRRGPDGSSTSEEGEGGEGDLPRQWNDRGLRRLVDGHAPLVSNWDKVVLVPPSPRIFHLVLYRYRGGGGKGEEKRGGDMF